MKRLNRFVSESLLDDENELINSGDLEEISYTGIKYIDKKVDEMNSKMKAPIIYDRVEKLIEITSSFKNEFKKNEITNLLPSNFIKGVDLIADTVLRFKENPLDIANEMDTFRSAINFIKKIQESSLNSIKEFAKSQVFLNSTYLGKTSKIKFGEYNTMLSWEFYEGYEDMDLTELEKDLKKLKLSKGKSKMEVRLVNTSDSKIIDVIFYK